MIGMVINIVAWTLCALIVFYLVFDIIRVEKVRIAKEKEQGIDNHGQ